MARGIAPLALDRLHAEERTFLTAVSRLAAEESGRKFVADLYARVLSNTDDAAENLRSLLDETDGVPTFFTAMGRLRIRAAALASRRMQQAAPAEVRRVFRATFGEHVLPTQTSKLNRRVDSAIKEGVIPVLNPLRPHVFGEDGAKEYADTLMQLLQSGTQAGLVVQPWRLCPRLTPCSPGVGATALSAHLHRLLTAANERVVVVETRCSDTMPIIVEALKMALAHDDCDHAHVALMLPGYLRSSLPLLRDLADWAKPRSERGARPLEVLLVKGNYLDDERHVAALYGTEAQLCANKLEAEACYMRLVHAAIKMPAEVITPVVGTHELTHLCYAALRWAHSGREGLPPVCFTLGLGNHIARQFARMGARAMLCAPLASDDPLLLEPEQHLLNMLRELARPEGFLTYGSSVEALSGAAGGDRTRSLRAANNTDDEAAHVDDATRPAHLGALLNRAETDAFYQAAEAEAERPQEPLPLCPGGHALESPLTCIHRSLTVPGLPDYRFSSADYPAVEYALQQVRTRAAAPCPPEEERARALQKAARALRRNSTELEALLVRDAGFTLQDAGVELRNAQDALRYYAGDVLRGGFRDGTVAQPLGVVAVAGNTVHPLADAVAAIAAAWIAGNTILYKPAAYTTLTGLRLTKLFEEAGVKLLCLPCVDNEIAMHLLTDPRVDALICSGGAELVKQALHTAPGSSPFVQRRGGSSVYLSDQCDWEAALPDIVAAAFARSGQGPACPHTLIAHAAVYDNPAFVAALGDAVSSLSCMPGWREGCCVGPLSVPIGSEQRALIAASQQKDSAWPLPMRAVPEGSLLIQPGLCLDAAPDSAFARHAHGLPALGLVRVDGTDDALIMQRSLSEDSEGSCCIIYSDNADEVARWKEALQPDMPCLAVNCCPAPRPGFVPTPTLCASRQSACAPMAGGSNYASALCHWHEQKRPGMRSTRRCLSFDAKSLLDVASEAEDTMRLSSAADSISYWWEREFGTAQQLPPQHRSRAVLTYRAMSVCLRVERAMSDADVAIALMVALQAGCRIRLSLAEQRAWLVLFAEQHGLQMTIENRVELTERFAALAAAGMILRDPAAMDDTLAAANEAGLPVITEPVLANARVEFTRFMREQLCVERWL